MASLAFISFMPVTSKLAAPSNTFQGTILTNASLETVLHTSPILTSAWFTPMALGGIILSIVGGLILHILSGKILMTISTIGFLLCSLLFALIPEQNDSGNSRSFLYWAYVFPAMLAATLGIDITYTVTNIFITTSMPSKHQAAAGALINSLVYLGIAFWLGIAELAVSSTVRSHDGDLSPRKQYKIAFWTATGLAVITMVLMATIKLGKASSELTADEKAELAKELERRGNTEPAAEQETEEKAEEARS